MPIPYDFWLWWWWCNRTLSIVPNIHATALFNYLSPLPSLEYRVLSQTSLSRPVRTKYKPKKTKIKIKLKEKEKEKINKLKMLHMYNMTHFS